MAVVFAGIGGFQQMPDQGRMKSTVADRNPVHPGRLQQSGRVRFAAAEMEKLMAGGGAVAEHVAMPRTRSGHDPAWLVQCINLIFTPVHRTLNT
ncbi:hypothetical protein SD70_02120 [Gordoniibacillus kamchatkensis]|uniref:Uncharacterized protein n=1 Tax=Gordoniibacillus kamchatkensis TaxID=1590651 RepID=A0ABR5AMY5_9BACL|nr:hypothetical protein SD70_02120 [Paenibacillus sp. VKM B-2647]